MRNEDPKTEKKSSEREARAADSGSDAAQAFSYLGMVFEFLGILGFLPLVGYFLDRQFSGGGAPGPFFFGGLALGFLYGLYHLYIRARSVVNAPRRRTPPSSRVDGREGYPRDMEKEAQRIRRELDDVGKRIDKLRD